jgi:nitrogen fixation NifU-like protein
MVQLIEGKTVEDAMKFYDAFHMLMNSRGEGVDEQVEDMLENAIVFSGTSKFPARIKCALLGWEAMKDSIVKSGAFVMATHEH